MRWGFSAGSSTVPDPCLQQPRQHSWQWHLLKQVVSSTSLSVVGYVRCIVLTEVHEKVNGLGEGTLSTVRPYLTDTLHKLLAERGIDLSVVLLQSLNQVNTGKSLPHDHDSRASYTRRLCNAIVSAVHASRRQGTAHAASPTGAVLLFVALNQRHARVHSSGTSRPLSDSESSNVLRIMSANLMVPLKLNE